MMRDLFLYMVVGHYLRRLRPGFFICTRPSSRRPARMSFWGPGSLAVAGESRSESKDSLRILPAARKMSW